LCHLATSHSNKLWLQELLEKLMNDINFKATFMQIRSELIAKMKKGIIVLLTLPDPAELAR
jgi:hypothetical protein